jgi:hypothetical protein
MHEGVFTGWVGGGRANVPPNLGLPLIGGLRRPDQPQRGRQVAPPRAVRVAGGAVRPGFEGSESVGFGWMGSDGAKGVTGDWEEWEEWDRMANGQWPRAKAQGGAWGRGEQRRDASATVLHAIRAS